jgi:hypothetical protein
MLSYSNRRLGRRRGRRARARSHRARAADGCPSCRSKGRSSNDAAVDAGVARTKMPDSKWPAAPRSSFSPISTRQQHLQGRAALRRRRVPSPGHPGPAQARQRPLARLHGRGQRPTPWPSPPSMRRRRNDSAGDQHALERRPPTPPAKPCSRRTSRWGSTARNWATTCAPSSFPA